MLTYIKLPFRQNSCNLIKLFVLISSDVRPFFMGKLKFKSNKNSVICCPDHFIWWMLLNGICIKWNAEVRFWEVIPLEDGVNPHLGWKQKRHVQANHLWFHPQILEHSNYAWTLVAIRWWISANVLFFSWPLCPVYVRGAKLGALFLQSGEKQNFRPSSGIWLNFVLYHLFQRTRQYYKSGNPLENRNAFVLGNMQAMVFARCIS